MTLVCEFTTVKPYTLSVAIYTTFLLPFPCYNPFSRTSLTSILYPLLLSPPPSSLPLLSLFPYPSSPMTCMQAVCPPRSYTPLVLELLINVAINAATLYLFLARSFKWPNSDQWQRFMWRHATPVVACSSITSSRWYACNLLNISNLL